MNAETRAKVAHGHAAIAAGSRDRDTVESDAADTITNVLLAAAADGAAVNGVCSAAVTNYHAERDHLLDDDGIGREMATADGLGAIDAPMLDRVMSDTVAAAATPENMRRFEEMAGPHRKVDTPDGPATVEPLRCLALDPASGETFSASSGDYWDRPDNEPLTNEAGEPLVLVLKRTLYVDALTGERI